MAFKLPSEMLQKVSMHKALRHSDGKLLLWSNPCLIFAHYILVYLQRLIEKDLGIKEAMRLFYFIGKFQCKIGMKIVNKRFGYAKRLIDKKRLLEFNIGQGELMGVGVFKFKRMDFKNNIFIIEGPTNFGEEYKRFFGVQKEAADFLTTGMMAGFIEEIMGVKVLCIESKCVAKGNDTCQYIVKPIEKWDKKDHLLKGKEGLFKKIPSMQELGAKIDPYLILYQR